MSRRRPPEPARPGAPARWPASLVLGAAAILLAEALLLVDAGLRGWAIVPRDPLPAADGALQMLGRWVAVHITPLAWTAYLFLLDGLLVRFGRPGGARASPPRRQPARFALCYLSSIAIWLSFDWVNFGFLGAWDYHGLPENLAHRYLSYALAFGAINPAMFLTAELIRQRLPAWFEGYRLRLDPPARSAMMAAGLACVALPLLLRDPAGTLTLWLGWFLLLDPINARLGAPSLIADWRDGRWDRSLALLAGGGVCGLLWEFWNYWAVAKWTYDLPFLGPLEAVRYFEMPVLGLFGFPPFALECWAMFQTVLWVLARVGLSTAAPTDRRAVL